MKCNQWTVALLSVGLVSVASVAGADEAKAPPVTPSVQTALAATTLSGYVDTSAQWNVGPGDTHAPGYAFGGPTKADGFNLNVVDLNLEKDADAAEAWGAGYRVELWAGPDAAALATGPGGGDFAVKNAYVDLKAPVGTGLDVKVGVWDTIIGYEVADSPNNPNFTRSYGFSVEPTTHTGVLLGYTVNDMLSLNAGVADTYGPLINGRSVSSLPGNPPRETYKTWMASATFTASTNWGWVGGSTFSACIINGFDQGVPGAAPFPADQTSYYAGATLNTPLKELKVGASFDDVEVRPQPLTTFGGVRQNANQQVYGVYATYQLTEKMSLNGRAEYFEQSKIISGTGLPSKVLEGTFTVQYDLWKNVLSRVEARWDHQAGQVANGPFPAYGGAGAHGDGTLNNSYIFLANIVYKF